VALVAAVSALLIAGMIAVIGAIETGEARRGLADATGDGSRIVLGLDSPESAVGVAATVESAIADRGLGGALVVGVAGGDIVLAPDPAAVTGGQLLALDGELDLLRDVVEETVGRRPPESGGLRDTLAGLHAGIDARRGPTAVAVGLLGILTAVVMSAVACEPVRTRESDTRLLRARGARRRDVAGLAAFETAAVSVVGAAAGTLVVAVGSAVAGGASVGVPTAIGVVVAIPLVAGTVSAIATVRGTDGAASRARAVADVGVVVLAALVTALAIWRFIQAGSPLVDRADGTAILDPLVAVAPALALGLAALVAVGIATPLGRAAAAAFAGTSGISPVTSLRLASRRPARHALSITVVAFAIGTTTLAGSYHASLTALGTAPESLRVGADVRVTTIAEDIAAADVAAAGSPDAAMLVRSLSARGADERIQVLAVEAPRLADVMLDAGGEIDSDGMADTLGFAGSGVPLEGDSLTLTLVAVPGEPVDIGGGEVSSPGPPALEGRVTIASSEGSIETLPFTNADIAVVDADGAASGTTEIRAEETITLALPEGADWSLVGVGVASHSGGLSPAGAGEITALTSGGENVDLSGFRPAAGTAGAVEVTDSGLLFTPEASDGQPFTRAVARGVAGVVPAVMTAALASSLGLEVGDTISLELVKPAFQADFEIADVVPILPASASGEGMLVDLGTLSLASPVEIVPTQAWLATDDPATVAEAVRTAFPQTATIVADPRSAESAASTAWAFVLAAAGAIVLAIVVLTLRRTRDRADSRELALLAVLGLGRRRASRVRAQEDLLAVAMGALGGVAAGFATAWLVVAPLTRAVYGSVPDAYPIALRADPLPLVLSILVVVAVFALIVSTVRAPRRLAPLMREDE
jgi:hypothetical protein